MIKMGALFSHITPDHYYIRVTYSFVCFSTALLNITIMYADVVNNHQLALIRQAGGWQLIESADRKRAEEELRESEVKFTQVFESSPLSHWYYKPPLETVP